MSFISSTEIAQSKAEKKNAWKTILKEEERKYIEKQKSKQRKRERDDDKWMLPSVNKRLEKEPKLKHKKHKKTKKSKKNKKKQCHSSSSDSSDAWEEKHSVNPDQNDQLPPKTVQDDICDFDIFDRTTFSRSDIKQKSKKELERERKEKEQKELLSKLEINPYIKESGILKKETAVGKKSSNKFEKEWLLRSLKRMKEEASSSGKSLEDVAAERYGSWEKFQDMLGGDKNSSTKSTGFVKPSFDDDGDSPRQSPLIKRRTNTDSIHKKSWKRSKIEDKIRPDGTSVENVKKQPPEINDPQPTSAKKMFKNDNPKPTVCQSTAVTALSEKEKNQLAAKILKAELMGNKALAEKLKIKLQNARKAEDFTIKSLITERGVDNDEKNNSLSESSDEEMVVLTHTAKDGQVWPVKGESSYIGGKTKKHKVPTHGQDRERDRYFADDDRYSLKELVEREKTSTAEDQDEMFSRLATKQFNATDEDTLDDMFVSQAAKGPSEADEQAKRRQQAIASHKKLAKRLEKCTLCFGNPELPKHLIICIGKKCMLMLPNHQPLANGHSMIVPMHHCNTGTGLDEDVWEETKQFMKALTRMYAQKDLDCVFMQTCMKLSKSYHFFVDCIPLERELGDVAPIYFKKAIQESDSEWAQNKKLVDTKQKGVRQSIPKGLPYFSVDFGNDGGFAHVIEDENIFPSYFGREIIGGMLDVEPRLWRKPPRDHFQEQTKRALKFSKEWKEFDFTN